MWDSKLADNVSPDEVYVFRLSDYREWFSLHPFGEVLDRHNGEFSLCSSNGEWADQVYSPFCKWPGADDGRERFGGLSQDMGKSLTLVTLPKKIH